MTLASRIIHELATYTSDNPLNRAKLLEILRQAGYLVTDREMRASYSSDTPCLSNNRGYFTPQTKKESDDFYRRERRRGLTTLWNARRKKRLFEQTHQFQPKVEYVFDSQKQGAFL